MSQDPQDLRRQWLSVYLFFDGDIYRSAADRLLLDTVAPLAQHCLDAGWARRWFFIRYAAGGPHLRLRLDVTAATVEDCRQWIESTATVDTSAVTSLIWSPYDPEVERYGGPPAVTVAEELFCRSSGTAVELLRRLPEGDRAARLGKATLASLVLLHVFTGSARRAAELCRNYGTNYLHQMVGDGTVAESYLRAFDRGRQRQGDALAGYVEAVWRALDDGDSLTPEMDRYRQDLASCRDGLAELSRQRLLVPRFELQPDDPRLEAATIFPSYLHMMSNRLGVTVQEECYLATAMASTLEAIVEPTPDGTARVGTPEAGHQHATQ